MRDDLKISFVVPGYKCDEFIFRNIESILDQDYKNYEIIVVLNGLWETKGELIKSLHEKYGSKIVLHSLEQGGLPNANNFGYMASSGDIVSHLMGWLPKCWQRFRMGEAVPYTTPGKNPG